MNSSIILTRANQNILASVDQHGVSIFIGWTVGIPATDAIKYAQSFGESADYGFFPINGKVVLSHKDAKLTLTEQESNAILQLIRISYGV